jgi:hypothetical protein
VADGLQAMELVDSSEVLTPSLHSPGQANELWPFVTGTLWKSAKAIGALCTAIFLYDERSNQMRTAIVLENGHSVDFFGEDRFLELREPFEIEHLPIWQTMMSTKTYQWVDLTDEANLSCKWLIHSLVCFSERARETEDRRQNTGDRIQETEYRRQNTGDRSLRTARRRRNTQYGALDSPISCILSPVFRIAEVPTRFFDAISLPLPGNESRLIRFH